MCQSTDAIRSADFADVALTVKDRVHISSCLVTASKDSSMESLLQSPLQQPREPAGRDGEGGGRGRESQARRGARNDEEQPLDDFEAGNGKGGRDA